MKIEKKDFTCLSRRVIQLVVLFSLIVFLLVSVVIVIFSFNFGFGKRKDSIIKTSFVSHFNTVSNISSYGFAKIPSRILKNNEFISYRSENNVLFSVISSKFSGEEFECFGSCSCNEEIEERRNINILSKTLYFLVTAVSLSLSMKIASSYFSEECFLSLRNICPEENIESEVSYCNSKNFDLGSKIETEDDEEIDSQAKFEKAKGFERTYYCLGFCYANGNLKHEVTKSASENFDCEKYTIEGKVTVQTNKLGFISKSGLKGDTKAVNKFRREFLTSFCRSISGFQYNYRYCYSDGREIVQKRNVLLCVGGTTKYSNIRCRVVNKFSGRDGVLERKRLRELQEQENTK